jgi:hypothetical protein
MTGLKKTIYVKSQDIWDTVVAAAEAMDRSVSWYLMDCHRQNLDQFSAAPEGADPFEGAEQ